MQHIVMFKFRDDVPQAVRSQAATQFKHDIEALRATIAYCLQHPAWRLSLQTHKYLGIR